MDSFVKSTLSGLLVYMGLVLILMRFEDLQKVPWQFSALAGLFLSGAALLLAPPHSRWKGFFVMVMISIVAILFQG
jgi:ABC-type xylose transport system permease subunit